MTAENSRICPVYDPPLDLVQRWPDWRLVLADLRDGQAEFIDYGASVIVIDRETHKRDPELCEAHAIAHLDLHEYTPGVFTDDQEGEADTLAHIRLDRAGSR